MPTETKQGLPQLTIICALVWHSGRAAFPTPSRRAAGLPPAPRSLTSTPLPPTAALQGGACSQHLQAAPWPAAKVRGQHRGKAGRRMFELQHEHSNELSNWESFSCAILFLSFGVIAKGARETSGSWAVGIQERSISKISENKTGLKMACHKSVGHPYLECWTKSLC